MSPVLPHPDDLYEIQKEFSTLASVTYLPGMRLKLVELTEDSPFGFTSRIGNWRVECPFFAPPQPESVWSLIWYLIESGYIARIEVQ